MHHTLLSVTLVSSLLLITGCASREGVAPSQNSSLQAVSPSTTAVAQGGAMQRSLDAWLKEEWVPLTKNEPEIKTVTAADGTITQTKTQTVPTATATPDGKINNITSTQVITTTTTEPDGKVTTSTATVAETIDETPFTLQKYADKWKVYHDSKDKINEGKPKEISNVEKLQSMPVIGK